jgi:hypothetical protein
MDYQIVHNIPGRFRILIPRLATDPDYVQRLQGLVESINFVTEVRINPSARSLVVSYKTRTISSEMVQKCLINAIEQADPSTSHRPKETSTPVSPPVASKPTAKKNSQGIEEEQHLTTSTSFVSELATSDKNLDENSKTDEEEKPFTSNPKQFEVEEDPWETDTVSSSLPVSTTQKNKSLERETTTVKTKPDKENKVSSLSTAALAKRLQVTSQTLTRYRSKQNFVEWAQAKDPDGVAWSYDRQSKAFYPTISPANTSEATRNLDENC